MIDSIKKLIVNKLRQLADDIDAGNSNVNDEEAIELLSVIAHRAMSKEDCCIYLNVSRATFDNYIHDGFMPKGIKRRGRRDLIWYEDDIIRYKRKFSNVFNR